MQVKSIKATEGYQIIERWMLARGNSPFKFQHECWQYFDKNYSGLVIAPTGYGKTYSVFLAVVTHYLNHPDQYRKGLKLIWITPLRSLSKDIARAMSEALEEIGLDWQVGVRDGDTPLAEKQGQVKSMPDILIITPENLHLLFAQKNNQRYFSSLMCIAVDEWHELLGSKRGVLVELAISRLRSIAPVMRIWGISATIGNIRQAQEVLLPYADLAKAIVFSTEKKKIDIVSIIPDEIEELPWAGHLGIRLAPKVLSVIEKSNTTLIFTNTRSQAEMWYQTLLNLQPELAGQLAIHHGSVDFELRIWIEDMLQSGYLKAVIATSSLDLGVDFKPVDTVIQIGSPKGVARFLQRAGRSGHSPFETSTIYFLPTHALELLEAAALKEAARKQVVEDRLPMLLCFDVLVQYLITLAVGEGFDAAVLRQQIQQTYAFSQMNEEEWQWCLNFITKGGATMEAYEDFHKVVLEDGLFKVKSRRIAMLHRMNIGVIVSDVMLKVKFITGGYIGMIEEYFISKLKVGDAFVLAGRTLEFVMIKDMVVLVRHKKTSKAITPSWLGGRLPLSSNLSRFLRDKYTQAASADSAESELRFLKPLFDRQKEFSRVPKADELLVEMIDTKEGYHLFIYPFEGRYIHEIISALIAYRISKIVPISFSIAMNDYGLELLSDRPIPLDEASLKSVFSEKNLMCDIVASVNSTEMARRKFRDIACISGLVFQRYYKTSQTNKSIQASSGIIFKVFEEYDNQNLLLRQSFNEVFVLQMDEARLHAAFRRINEGKIILARATAFTPLSFPIKVDSLRQSLSSEDLEARVLRMQKEAMNTKKNA